MTCPRRRPAPRSAATRSCSGPPSTGVRTSSPSPAPPIVVVLSWETYQPVAGDVVLDLDPGMAFGTGTHASTKLCLGELDRLATAGVSPDRFLDVGAGSGILAIAAAKLWPAARGV